MKIIKVSEASGAALDWAVAKCKRLTVMKSGAGPSAMMVYIPTGKRSYYKYRPSTNWAQGGPIIERERIDLDAYKTDWEASMRGDAFVVSSGPTPLIAAMRCLVASKLGGNVDIPEELK